MPITVTYDLEDDGSPNAGVPRYERVTDRLLEMLARRSARATVFVVGELAERSPDLVRRIADAGHEVALHGHRHVAIADLGGEPGFTEDVRRGQAVIEDVLGQAVQGYRAPMFSLTPSTLPWAPERLAELGFAYSSSVLPAPNPIAGHPGAPRTPFRWPSGVVELPCPVLGRGRAAVPYLGGVYLRYLPSTVLRRAVRQLGGDELAWTYVHPYDFDAGAPFVVLPHAGWLTSRIVQSRRGGAWRRLEAVLDDAGGAAPPLGERARAVADQRLPAFSG